MKNKKMALLLILFLILMPTIVFASNGDDDFPIALALGMEAFISLHMSGFVLMPLSEMFSKENSKKTFWILFLIRACILLYFDFFVTPYIAMVDFAAVFIGAFIVVPICAVITKKKVSYNSGQVDLKSVVPTTPVQNQVNGVELKCARCNAILQITDKFCPSCGEAFDGNNVIVSENSNTSVKVPPKVAVHQSDFDTMYSLSEENLLEEFINKELTKAGIDKASKLIPSDILKRKKILNIIFSFLIFLYITLIFFHFPIYTYIIGIVILFIFFIVTRKYDLMKYLKKQLKARPGEKISNIVTKPKKQ